MHLSHRTIQRFYLVRRLLRPHSARVREMGQVRGNPPRASLRKGPRGSDDVGEGNKVKQAEVLRLASYLLYTSIYM